jgi:PIN domain nuclease of toxin-antitoxin system
MKILLDTHALLWWLLDDPRLTPVARRAISPADHQVLVSSASAWEISTKHRLGKLPEIGEIIDKLPRHLRQERFEVLPVGFEHALMAGQLPGPHRDPFDRMLIAQARKEDLRVVTGDPVFAEYRVKVIW